MKNATERRWANSDPLLFFKNAAGPDGPRSEDRFFEWLDHDPKEHEGGHGGGDFG